MFNDQIFVRTGHAGSVQSWEILFISILRRLDGGSEHCTRDQNPGECVFNGFGDCPDYRDGVTHHDKRAATAGVTGGSN